MKKLIFTLFLLLSSIIVTTAQDVNTALRYLKIANTLREVKQFDQSEEYLNKALGMVRGRNEYWEAAIYENLGFLYRDQENVLEASRNFSKAIDIYKKLKMGMSEKAISQLLDGLKEAEELYAGIDIGSKGVKLSIIGVTVSPKKGVTYNLKKSMSINTEPSALTTQAIKETATAIKGLKQATDKQPGKEAEVIAAIRDALKNPNQKIDIISAEDEAKYGALSMVAPELHLSSSVMDIGGGNIKGGYLLSRTKFEAVNFPYGTKAFVKIVKKKLPDANLEEYTKGVNDEVKVVGEELALELNRKVGLKNRKNVFLLGGIVFVMNSFLHPERAAIIGRPVEVSLEDIRKFRQMSASSYEELINPDFSRVTDPAVRAIAEEDVKNITTKIYNQQDIIAGAALLETLIKEMNRDGVQKRFYFIKGGDVAWISGYVFKLISDEYQARKE